tara:strand:+ start:14 stop:883 length:870 start_codon:yes stop_codon:yes gene_type:complete
MEKKLFNDLPLEKKIEFTKKNYNSVSFFQNQISKGKSNIEIDISSYSDIFRKEINRLLNKKKILAKNIELEKIHKFLKKSMKNYNLKHGVNRISQMFYETDEKFRSSYFSFVKFLSKNVFKFPFYIQEVPTIRIQCPGGKNRHFYPRYHNDISLGHPFGEINLWIPLTKKSKKEKHGFRLMSLSNTKKSLIKYGYNLDYLLSECINKRNINFKFNPISNKVNTQYGKMLAFDARCLHSSEIMISQTRASIDVRIIPVKEFSKMKYKHQGLGKRKILFEPGGCYFKNSFR